jgi:hypothetical protein
MVIAGLFLAAVSCVLYKKISKNTEGKTKSVETQTDLETNIKPLSVINLSRSLDERAASSRSY